MRARSWRAAGSPRALPIVGAICILVLLGAVVALDWSATPGVPSGQYDSAQRLGLGWGAFHPVNGSAPPHGLLPITYAIEGLEAQDIQFCYQSAGLTPLTLPFNVLLLSPSGASESEWSSASARECVYPGTGLSSTLLFVGGWVEGPESVVVAGENLSIQILPNAGGAFWLSYWTPEASLMTSIPL